MLSSNPTRAFVEKCIEVNKNGDSRELKQDVHDAYQRFCNHHNLGVDNSYVFGRKLKREFGFKDIQARDNKYYWVGIRLIDFTGTQEGQATF